ncbi:MAG: hypothetical protein ACI4JN_04485 [Ruminococcus sp.]
MDKNYLPFEDENWNKIVEDAFAPDAQVHVFSDRYQRRKERLMRKNIQNNNKKPVLRRKTVFAVAAAVAVAVAVPTSVFAGSRIYNAFMDKPAEYQRNITIDAGESPSMEVKALNIGWVPDDMTIMDGEEHTALIKYHSDSDEMRGISVLFWKIPTGDSIFQDTLKGAVSSETYTDINGNTVLLVEHSQDWQERHDEAWIAFKDTPYAAQVYIMGNVTDSERTQILDNMYLESWDSEVAMEWSENKPSEEPADIAVSHSRVNMSDMKLAKIGDVISYELDLNEQGLYEAEVKIEDIRIQNNFDGITTDSFNNPADYSEYMNADGTVADNICTWIRLGDGVNTIDEKVSEELQPQSIIVMDVTYKNTGSIDFYECICPTIEKIDRDGNIQYGRITEDGMTYSDSMDDLKTDNMMFSIKTDYANVSKNNLEPFKAGDTANVQIAFLVNTEDIPNLYLNINPTGREIADEIGYGSSFVDLSFLAEN